MWLGCRAAVKAIPLYQGPFFPEFIKIITHIHHRIVTCPFIPTYNVATCIFPRRIFTLLIFTVCFQLPAHICIKFAVTGLLVFGSMSNAAVCQFPSLMIPLLNSCRTRVVRSACVPTSLLRTMTVVQSGSTAAAVEFRHLHLQTDPIGGSTIIIRMCFHLRQPAVARPKWLSGVYGDFIFQFGSCSSVIFTCVLCRRGSNSDFIHVFSLMSPVWLTSRHRSESVI